MADARLSDHYRLHLLEESQLQHAAHLTRLDDLVAQQTLTQQVLIAVVETLAARDDQTLAVRTRHDGLLEELRDFVEAQRECNRTQAATLDAIKELLDRGSDH